MPIVVTLTEVAQQLIFDPVDEGTGTELDVMASPYGLTALDAPAPQPEFVWAGSIDTEGEARAAGKHQNRRVSITVDVAAGNATSRDAALDTLAAKAAKVFREGGTLRLVKQTGDYRTLDLLAADAYEPTFDVTYSLGLLATVTMGFVAKPYAREPEVTLADHVETTLPLLTFTEATILGDVPGLGRLVIDNDAGTAQYWMVWGVESMNYSSASTASLFYEAESLTMVSGVSGADGTASGGNPVRLTSTPAGVSSFKATGRTHIGSFRVIARAKVSDLAVRLRAFWTPLGPEIYTANDQWAPTGSAWEIADLGIVSPGMGTPPGQPWTLEVQGTGPGAATVDVDWIALIPIREGSGEASGIFGTTPSTPTGSSLLPASGSFTVRHDAALKGPDGSSQYGPPGSYTGDYLLVPPSGSSARSARFVIKLARGSVTTVLEDGGIDDLSARLSYTPRYLSLA